MLFFAVVHCQMIMMAMIDPKANKHSFDCNFESSIREPERNSRCPALMIKFNNKQLKLH